MLTPTHQTSGLWRHPDADPEQYRDLGFWTAHAQLLESAGFDTVFFADVAGVYDIYGGSGATVADELQRWLTEAGVDGFNVDYALRGPDMAAFAEHVSPVLRACGLLRESAGTLRGQLTGEDLLPATRPAAGFRRG